jgi:pyrimidine operon attenuation protein/uracil phosphoribosyltransferase
MQRGDVARAIQRIAHEIVERNHDHGRLAVVGLQRGGVWIAQQLASKIASIDTSLRVSLGSLDVSMYRDDLRIRPVVDGSVTDIDFDVTDMLVVLVDDVLFTGRTVRAALEGLNSFGRPRAVQLAVLVDRGHRELPIRPDFVGKNIPTHSSDEVLVSEDGVIVKATQ